MAIDKPIRLPDLKAVGLFVPLAIHGVRRHSRLVICFGMKIFGSFE